MLELHIVAEKLGKFAHEVAEIGHVGVARWIAYFKLKSEQEKLAQERARKKAGNK